MGLVGSRADTIRRVASAATRGELSFAADADPADVYNALTSIKGVGDWTAQYVLMRGLKQPDAFPASDLGLLKAAGGEQKLTPRELKEEAEAWRPWRAYAAMILWNSLSGSGG